MYKYEVAPTRSFSEQHNLAESQRCQVSKSTVRPSESAPCEQALWKGCMNETLTEGNP